MLSPATAVQIVASHKTTTAIPRLITASYFTIAAKRCGMGVSNDICCLVIG